MEGRVIYEMFTGEFKTKNQINGETENVSFSRNQRKVGIF